MLLIKITIFSYIEVGGGGSQIISLVWVKICLGIPLIFEFIYVAVLICKDTFIFICVA